MGFESSPTPASIATSCMYRTIRLDCPLVAAAAATAADDNDDADDDDDDSDKSPSPCACRAASRAPQAWSELTRGRPSGEGSLFRSSDPPCRRCRRCELLASMWFTRERSCEMSECVLVTLSWLLALGTRC